MIVSELTSADAMVYVIDFRFVGPQWRAILVGAGCDGASLNLDPRNTVAPD